MSALPPQGSWSLHGRTAVVTGCTRGIGRAIAETLRHAGAGVLAHGIEPAEAAALAHAWQPSTTGTGWSVADLGHSDGAALLASDAERYFGLPDILVLNASVEIREDWRELTPAAIAAQNTVNLSSTIALVQLFLPAMIERRWGRILAIGSVQETRPNASHIYYAATKLAQTSIILNLARTQGNTGVTFNILRPGAIETDRNREVLADPERRAAVIGQIPIGRIGSVDDCIGAALLLCSDAGSYINGEVLSVDGGMGL